MQVVISWCIVADAHVVEYVSVSLLVSVSLMQLEMLLNNCNSNLRCVSEGCSSVSHSPRKLIRVDRGSPYAASQLEDGFSLLTVQGEGTHSSAPNIAASSSQ